MTISHLTATKYCSISVFFPCYNDYHTIANLITEAETVLSNIAEDYEIIVIDDGSTDGSRKLLADMGKTFPRLKVIFHDNNLGYGRVLRSGFAASQKDLIFYTDGDGQYDIRELPILLELMTKDINFVNGIKIWRNDPEYRIILGNFYRFLVRWAFWLPIYDVDCDFRLIRRGVLNKISLECGSGAVCVELVKKAQQAGARFREVSVHHYERQYGKSQFFKPQSLFNTAYELLRYWVLLLIKR